MNNGGVLSGKAIKQAIEEGSIRIEPLDLKQLNPVSYDLTLGDEVLVYEGVNYIHDVQIGASYPKDGAQIQPWRELNPRKNFLDSKKANPTRAFKIGPEGWLVQPGVGYLMHTRERIWTDRFEPIIDGKSSLGRLFVWVHITAGYGEPGFDGQYTLEVVATHPVRLYAGQRVCQMRFLTIMGEIDLYDGHYKGDTAKGAVASHYYEQFDK